MSLPPPALTVERVNELIAYHELVLRELAGRRTNLTSGLIPVREYIILSNIESWHRWPEIMVALDEAVGAEEIGRRLREPGHDVSAAYLWAIVTLSLAGRTVREKMGMDPPDVFERASVVLDFWQRCSAAWRGDGFAQAWDAGDVVRPYPAEVIARLDAHATPVGDDGSDTHAVARRFLASMMQYLFLLYMDTRMGTGDSGPYPLEGGRTMIVREFFALDGNWMPWGDVADGVPHANLVCALVFKPGVQNRVTDFGSTVSVPVDNLQYLERLGIFASDGHGTLTPLDHDAMTELLATTKKAQAVLYRRINGWTDLEKITAGAHVYFRGLIRPFTVVAGIDDQFDWTVPRDAADFIPFLDLLPPNDEIGDEPIYSLFPT